VRQSVILPILVTAATVLVMATGAQSQTPAPQTTMSATATLTAKIIAIDQENRIITLQDAQGNAQSIKVGPGVKRFDELKVGETVVFTYLESVATSIVKPGTAMPMASSSPTMTRFTGEKPGGQISQTVTTTVTIKSIDMATPAITVVTQQGKAVSLLVNDKNNLVGLKVGDVVQLTYTQTLTIQVK
jgi:hypothetical protein